MPVFSDHQNQQSQRTNPTERTIEPKTVMMWAVLAMLIIGVWWIASRIVHNFNLQTQTARLQSNNPEFRVFEALSNNHHPLKVDFIYGDSPDINLANHHTKGTLYLNQDRQVVDLELQPTSDLFYNSRPILKIMPQYDSYFLKLNLQHNRTPALQPLNFLANLEPFHEIMPNIQRLYNQPSRFKLNDKQFVALNQHLTDLISQQTTQQWLKLDHSLVKTMLANNSEQALDLCFLSEAVFLRYRFWDVEHSDNQQQIINLKFNPSKFLQVTRSDANKYHPCFKNLQTPDAQNNIINRLKDLHVTIHTSANGFLPQKVIAFQQASDGAIRYRARLDFSPLQDGIESAEPNYLYASSLIKDLDREVKNFTQATTKR